MILISNTTVKDTTCTIVKGIPVNRSTVVESDDENSCSSTNSHGAIETVKETVLLRHTTASIADALLKLGNSDDSSSSSSIKRKRAVSLAAAESDAASTSSQSTATDTDMQSTHKHANKRQRKSPTPPSQVVCPVPKKLCKPDISKSALDMIRQRRDSKLSDEDKEEEQALSFSTSEFQSEVQIKQSDRKIPGDIGCISQMFHQDFRPLMAAPRMPRHIVPEDKPQMPCMRSPYAPPANPATMYSTAITEHKDCLIMHSYTVLPRMITPHMALAQLSNGM